MPTLHEEKRIEEPIPNSLAEPRASSSLRKNRWALVWFYGLRGLLVLGLSLSWGGLLILRGQLGKSWSAAAEKFQFVVLVQGSQVEVDEVGRTLGQMEGVARVSYLSPEDSLQRLKADPLFNEDLAYLSGDLLPASWQVHWRPGHPRLSRLELILQDIKAVPGVLDVGWDRLALDTISSRRAHWLEVRLVLILLALTASVLALALLGRALFFGVWWKPGRSEMKSFLIDAVWWTAGFLLLRQCVAPLTWHALWGAPALSAFRYLWRSASPAQAGSL